MSYIVYTTFTSADGDIYDSYTYEFEEEPTPDQLDPPCAPSDVEHNVRFPDGTLQEAIYSREDKYIDPHGTITYLITRSDAT